MEPLGEGDPRWVGGYRLLGGLGAGGMGRVYLARSERGRTVAVKVVRAELARERSFRERFAKEVTAARRVGGQWTAPVLDADTEADTPWVATGYIAGPSLQSVVEEDHGPLPEHSVYALAAGLVGALRAIHGAGLVHRDLKPSNVLVTIDGPKVIDFGIARALDSVTESGLTQTGAVIGSPGFMSPEQVRGERVTPASDIFCLGSVLAFAATGRMPFGGDDSGLHALLFRIASEPPDLTGLSGSLRELVAACLAKEPADRPSLDDLAARVGPHAPAGGTWLPGEVLAQLGRHAVRLLDSEDPDAAAGAPFAGTAGAAVPPRPGTPPPPVSPVAVAPGFPAPGAVTAVPGPSPYPPAPPPTGPIGPYVPQQPWHSTPPQGAGPYPGPPGVLQPLRGLSLALCATLSAVLLYTLVEFVLNIRLYNALDAPEETPLGDLRIDQESLRTTTDAMAGLGLLFGLPVVVLWVLWFWRARANAEVFAPGRIRHSQGWAIGSWFTPAICLFMPKQIVNDVWDHSDPAADRGNWYGPRRRGTRGLLNSWWTLWLCMLLGGILEWESWYESGTVGDAQGAAAYSIVLDLVELPATLLAILVVLRLTGMQESRGIGRR
ncbi:serine/threonine protein kinase [Streptomyces carminius]|uniref:Serine/threonine protein kinase n=1 Tax=Streptomyces carminius TaxID=2665496 RepID=A0A2M8LY36_9ACTN|nr:DUF4328 domain-containing protein [Streptomyces carminius]PJE96886.1 serine/threonine protein kinase [Streptomyces carminius]